MDKLSECLKPRHSSVEAREGTIDVHACTSVCGSRKRKLLLPVVHATETRVRSIRSPEVSSTGWAARSRGGNDQIRVANALTRVERSPPFAHNVGAAGRGERDARGLGELALGFLKNVASLHNHLARISGVLSCAHGDPERAPRAMLALV